MIAYAKVQSVAKRMMPRGPELRVVVRRTLSYIAQMVGATLGPGGRPVMIERQEADLPPIVTKDGVTVFKHLGFADSFQQMILESTRESAERVAKEAGDGTTTTAILCSSIFERMDDWCAANPQRSPQQAMRELERAFKDVEKEILGAAIPAQLGKHDDRLLAVASVSANGDEELATAVLDCFRICGDSGNVTLMEANGPSRYVVEEVDGYPIATGWEDCCRKFGPEMLNEPELGRCRMERPLFLIFNGPLLDAAYLQNLLGNVAAGLWAEGRAPRDYVLVASRFSEHVLAMCATCFNEPNSIRLFPLEAPLLPVANSQVHFMEDLAAVTGARVFNSLTRPLDRMTMQDLGAYEEPDPDRPGQTRWQSPIEGFEVNRYRSSVYGHADDDELADRVAALEQARGDVESEIEARLLQERIAKLSGGIARLRIFGLSNAETKEKRDRAEDAVCAVRGAVRQGILPGAGWTLLRVAGRLREHPSSIVREILAPALLEPVHTLFANAGYSEEERVQALTTVLRSIDGKPEKAVVYDLLAHGHVSALKAGLFDSTPAVMEAVRCSLSIASRQGGLGGLVAFARDRELEREEATASTEFERHVKAGRSSVNYVDRLRGDEDLPE